MSGKVREMAQRWGRGEAREVIERDFELSPATLDLLAMSDAFQAIASEAQSALRSEGGQ